MNNLDVVITGAQGEGKSRLARDIMRQVLPSASRAKDFADIDDLMEISIIPDTITGNTDLLKAFIPKYIIYEISKGISIEAIQQAVSLYRDSVKFPVFAIYAKQALLALLLSLCLVSCKEPKEIGCVTQEIDKSEADGKTKLYTYVWYRDKIISAQNDPITSVSDSLAIARKNEGLALIKTIKGLNVKPITVFK